MQLTLQESLKLQSVFTRIVENSQLHFQVLELLNYFFIFFTAKCAAARLWSCHKNLLLAKLNKLLKNPILFCWPRVTIPPNAVLPPELPTFKASNDFKGSMGILDSLLTSHQKVSENEKKSPNWTNETDRYLISRIFNCFFSVNWLSMNAF